MAESNEANENVQEDPITIPTNDQMMNLAAAADPIRVYEIPTNDQTINHLLASTSSSIRVHVIRNQTPWRSEPEFRPLISEVVQDLLDMIRRERHGSGDPSAD
ncbi:hypothetical protein AALP_AA6G044600 [Arabis alpina]|uniref:Uncharacterized protein n=1 Tax=Arabis alpina TaxID=50452 RepID=A0A087GM29_ARAAL|nr:hypothetical protein AALP_AA6G044600 [Arabis alpina]